MAEIHCEKCGCTIDPDDGNCCCKTQEMLGMSRADFDKIFEIKPKTLKGVRAK